MPTLRLHVPSTYEIAVSPGEAINFDTIIARHRLTHQRQAITVPLARLLRFTPQNIDSYLQHPPGKQLRKGDVVAQVDGLLKTRAYLADCDGVLTHVNRTTGEITIVPNQHNETNLHLMALASGVVAAVSTGVVEVTTKDLQSFPLFSPVQERCGGLCFITDRTRIRAVFAEQVKDHVVASAAFEPYMLSKLAALDARAIVCDGPVVTKTPVQILRCSSTQVLNAFIDFYPDAVYASASDTMLYGYHL
jgi:hypothetical protein